MPKLRKLKRFFLSTTLFLYLGCFYGYGQPGIANELANKLTTYSQQNLQEKIFAHTDKLFYVCGEIIWFKLYNVDAYFNKPLTISKIAYVELLSSDQKPLLRAKIELNEGTGSGSFMLPFSLNSGIYILRAYTSWMKNFSPDLFFESQLTIINPLKKLNHRENDSTAYGIQFFPEGGNLVTGLQSKVAFHAVNQDGRGIACKGMIINQHNDSITSFESLRFGMGCFYFTPAKGDSYKAIVQTETGKTIIRDLPTAYESGFVMKLTLPDKETIKVSVYSNYSNTEPILLLVHTRQIIKQVQSKMVTGGFAEFIINKKELAEGVSHFTLFNNKRQPLCERLYFQQPKEKLNIGINTLQEEYSLRKKVSIELSSHDISIEPTKADLSLSVFRVDSLQSMPDADIQSYLWLSSELRGTIESSSYYFNSIDSKVAEAADNLMLTQGWSRFKWEEVLSNKKTSFQFLPEYEGPVITGKVIEISSGLPAKNITTYLTVPGEKFVFKTSTSDINGNIFFNLTKFYGSNKVIVQVHDRMKSLYTINISTPFNGNSFPGKYPSLQIPEKWQDQLLSYSIGTQVENVYVQDKKQQFYFPDLTDTTAFYGKPDNTYFLDDYTRFITMEEVLREYVGEVRARKQQEQFTYKVYNSANKLFFDNEPLVLLDGVPLFDITKLMEYDPLKIKKLEVVTKKIFFGNDTFEGIASYTTYKGNLDDFQLDAKALIMEYQGLQLQREFYSPVYETKEQTENRIPDFRNLLYWSPDLKTYEKGYSQISFYTSDRPGKYAVVVQGINSNGIAGSKSMIFTVNK